MHRILSSSPAESLSADGEEAHARPGRSMMGLSTRKEYNIYEEDELDAELLALGFEVRAPGVGAVHFKARSVSTLEPSYPWDS